jgi:hypothetical protein
MAKCPTCTKFVESVNMQYLRARGPAPPGWRLVGVVCAHCDSLLGTVCIPSIVGPHTRG